MSQMMRSVWIGVAVLMSTQAHAWFTPEGQDEVMKLTPNLEQGRRLYETCAICHTPLGWGTPDGRYPEIAGQHPNVIVKQLADIRIGNRDNPTMYPFTLPNVLPTAQAVADIAAYISQLPMNPNNEVGPGHDLAYGEMLYKENCAECHGDTGEGNNKEFYPRIHGQTYHYLLRQMQWIKIGKRRNADKTMVDQIHKFSGRDIQAVVDYTSRLRPPKEMLAEQPEWRNPDFPVDFRTPPLPFQFAR
jgi:cytochrome c553